MSVKKSNLDYKPYVQTDEEYEDYGNVNKIKFKGHNLQFFCIEANLGIVVICLQKAFLYHGLNREKILLLSLYATRPSLSTLKITVNAVRKFFKMA